MEPNMERFIFVYEFIKTLTFHDFELVVLVTDSETDDGYMYIFLETEEYKTVLDTWCVQCSFP